MDALVRLRQRSDYTFKLNAKTGRHGWLRLTPAYSVKIVEELIERCDRPMRIFDPFCGTATTALSAAYHGHEGVTTDINPFLIWLGQVKTAIYTEEQLERAEDAAGKVLRSVAKEAISPFPVPPIHNIERWWPQSALDFLCLMRSAIEEATSPDTAERNLLLVAFCRLLISCSNAAFNHQSMSFKDRGQALFDLEIDYREAFRTELVFVLEGASHNPRTKSSVILGDSRSLGDRNLGLFDRVITSPPYANRMSYIRELRPYMYWLGFLRNSREAGELDWTAIGGTWGVATSRLNEWERSAQTFSHPVLETALDRIAHQDNKNGRLLAIYVGKYFDDMWAHMQSLPPILARDAEVHYIVGNSTFYGVLLPVELLYAAMLERLGFADVQCRPIRKRNSKKELVEFDVTGVWPQTASKRAKRKIRK